VTVAKKSRKFVAMPAYCHPAAYAAFARAMSHVDTTRGLLRAACAIALHENLDADVDQAEATIGQLAGTVKSRVRSPNPQSKLAHLHDVLFDVVGFGGNIEDYFSPANSYLPDVLATRRGLPITLVLIYKCVAEEVGLVVRGVNSPGHFLAAVQCPEPGRSSATNDSWMYVDPFYGGGLLTEEDVFRRIAEATGRDDPPSPEWLAHATHRQWLARMLNNLLAVFAHTGRERDLYAMQELQSLLPT
jgi:regulator of sirC expression with transglutaminase-like and TPR domain